MSNHPVYANAKRMQDTNNRRKATAREELNAYVGEKWPGMYISRYRSRNDVDVSCQHHGIVWSMTSAHTLRTTNKKVLCKMCHEENNT